MPEYKVGLENITTKDVYLNSRPIWGRIINFYFYKIFLNFITFSPRRQFLILAVFTSKPSSFIIIEIFSIKSLGKLYLLLENVISSAYLV